MTIHSPDDELDERWKAMHEHPELAKIKSFDSLDLVAKAHANDPPPEAQAEKPPAVKRRAQPEEPQTDVVETDEPDDASLPNDGEKNIDAPAGDVKEGTRFFDDDETHTVDQQIGHDMMNEEYRNWMNKPTVIEVDDYPI